MYLSLTSPVCYRTRSLLDCLLESMDASIDASHGTPATATAATAAPTPLITMATAKDGGGGSGGGGEEEKTGSGEEKAAREEVKSSGQTARILKLIAFLVNHATVKTCFLHLCRTNGYASSLLSHHPVTQPVGE